MRACLRIKIGSELNNISMKIFGIPIDIFTKEEVLRSVEKFLTFKKKFYQIATVNPEFLLEAKENKQFKKALLACDMRISDGFGITLAHWLRGKRAPDRYPGANLMMDLLKIANKQKLSVFLVCRLDGLSSYEGVKQVITQRFPKIHVFGENVDVGRMNSELRMANSENPQSKKIHNSQFTIHNSNLILCNFGAPEQELFLASLRERGAIGLAIGVGGAFDYLTGKQKRAPIAMQKIGLEWVWRLAMQPRRRNRIWRATIVFFFLQGR